MREHPRDRQLSERHARLLRQRSHGVDGRELALVPVALLVPLRRVAEREARARRRSGVAAMLARQEATGERVVRDDAHPFLLTERQKIALGLAEQEDGARLHAIEARPPDELAAAQRPAGP